MTRVYNRASEKSLRRTLRHEMPRAEEVLWSKLRREQMMGCRFRRQYSVQSYVLDFYCPRARLAIEVDGDSHFQRGSSSKDAIRQGVIESFGIRFLRFRNIEIFEQLDVVLEAIRRELMQIGPP